MDNRQFRLMKLQAAPGPYTFISDATREVLPAGEPPFAQNDSFACARTQNARQLLLELLGAPLPLATTLILPEATEPLNDPDDIREQLQHLVDGIVDVRSLPAAGAPHPVLDLTAMANNGAPVVVREGQGSLAAIGL